MFTGRVLYDSHMPWATPTMATFQDHVNVAWVTGNGTIYWGRGFEEDGSMSPAPLPADASSQRPVLVAYPDVLYLIYQGLDSNVWVAASKDGETISSRQMWPEVGHIIAGPAATYDGEKIWVAWTAASDLAVHVAFANTPGGPFLGHLRFDETSIDTPALNVDNANRILLAWTGPDNDYRLRVKTFQGLNAWGFQNESATAVFEDTCLGGPTLCQVDPTVTGAFYRGFDNANLYELVGVETLQPRLVRRAKYYDTSDFAPRAHPYVDQLFVAWIGTDGERKLNLANLHSMPAVYLNGSG